MSNNRNSENSTNKITNKSEILKSTFKAEAKIAASMAKKIKVKVA